MHIRFRADQNCSLLIVLDEVLSNTSLNPDLAQNLNLNRYRFKYITYQITLKHF